MYSSAITLKSSEACECMKCFEYEVNVFLNQEIIVGGSITLNP